MVVIIFVTFYGDCWMPCNQWNTSRNDHRQLASIGCKREFLLVSLEMWPLYAGNIVLFKATTWAVTVSAGLPWMWFCCMTWPLKQNKINPKGQLFRNWSSCIKWQNFPNLGVNNWKVRQLIDLFFSIFLCGIRACLAVLLYKKKRLLCDSFHQN